MTFNIAPDWFIEAKKAGEDKGSILKRVEEFCLEAAKWDAEQKSESVDNLSIDSDWVNIMYEMYEHSYNLSKEI